MPLMKCESNGKPGWKYGQGGKCYAYTAGNASSEKSAKKKAVKQAIAVGGGKAPKDLSDRDLADAGIVREFKKWCRVCEQAKPNARFREDGRTSDGRATVCESCREAGKFAERETVDIDAVELLAAGGPYYGSGSPPEGDFFEEAFLDELAQAYGDLREEVRIPIKIGHNRSQKLLANSGLSPDEQPAAGWVENVRREGDKLLGDLKRVPKKLAELMKLDAFRTRSVELSRVTSQTLGGREFPNVLSGLALLGAKAPAVRTLDDILAWYAEANGAELVSAVRMLAADELDATVERTIDYATGDVAWDDENGSNDWQGDLSLALNGGRDGEYGPDGAWMPPRFWVRDVDQRNLRALVGDRELDYDALWVVPFELQGGDPVASPDDDWLLVTSAWIEAAGVEDAATSEATASLSSSFAASAPATQNEIRRLLGLRVDDPSGGADTTTMRLTSLNDEQVATFAAELGIEASDPAALRDALAENLLGEETTTPPTPPAPPSPAPPNPTPPAPAPPQANEELQAELAEVREHNQRNRIARREANLRVALSQGRIEPASLDGDEGWRAFFDANESLAITQLLAQPPRLDRTAAFGTDDSGNAQETLNREADGAYAHFANAVGVRPYSIAASQGGNQ